MTTPVAPTSTAALDAIYQPSSPTIGAIAAALAKAQGSLQNAVKASTNPQKGNRYADLTTILDVAREPMSAHGLAVVQAPYTLPGDPPRVVLVTTIAHESGEWLRSVTPVNGRRIVKGGDVVEDDTMMGVGAAITFARRYAIVAMLGIGQEDDDTGTGQAPQRQQPQRPAAQRPAPQRPAPQRPAPPERPGAKFDGDYPAPIPQAPDEAAMTDDQAAALGKRLKAAGLTDTKRRTLLLRWLSGNAVLAGPKHLTADQAQVILGMDEETWVQALESFSRDVEAAS